MALSAIVENQMLFTIGAVVVFLLLAVVFVPGMRGPSGVKTGALGSMSEQWLAEHRASHPL